MSRLKIRKYMEEEVVQSDFMGTTSEPITEFVQTKIGQGLDREKEREQSFNIVNEVNNLHLKKHIEMGVLYKNMSTGEELALMGATEFNMPLMSNSRKRLKVTVSPMYIYISGTGAVRASVKASTSFNPFTNVFGDISEVNIRDKYGVLFRANLQKLCLGSTLESKVVRNRNNRKYGALDILADWLSSTPNDDLSLSAGFDRAGFDRYIESSMKKGLLTSEQVGRISSTMRANYINRSSVGRMAYHYDWMLTMSNAITTVAPEIAGDFIRSSYSRGNDYDFDIEEAFSVLNKYK